ncbi:sporulation protein [Bacillaceae bacterium SIJ1]|uniref:YtrH family sporulation protein n=1 Tax=Litoribacterium kuwaitense TaxID=1398745 RepID=UPI0013ECDB08|nr:YtrH family sporulation protein [Litoribacterium kuwaitense]NGP45034.1 sporulation protein [Litoribacterium kuwaitense]
MKEELFIVTFLNCYFVALGVILGGSLVGGISAFLTGAPPYETIARLSQSLKIWGLVAAIGGTFDVISTFERGIFNGAPIDIFKQTLLIISAMAGAQSGAKLIQWLTQGSAM